MHCDVCRFDASAWTGSDLQRTLDVVAPWFAALCDGADDDVLTDLAPHAAHLARLPRGVVDVAAVHDAWHVLADAGRVRHRTTPSASGAVAGVHVSAGGVPKLPVPRVRVTAAGLEGDRQGDRRHHGRPWQAVSLWSAEVVADLVAEGHPVVPGGAGENVLLTQGLDWPAVRPGVQVLVGSALLEVTTYAIPCQKVAGSFSDRRFRRIASDVAPGRARVYARVLVDGTVATGDRVLVEPVAALLPRQAAPTAPQPVA